MESVRSLFIPIVGGSLLVPNAAIAEIIQYIEPEQADSSDDAPWLIGGIAWRDRQIPLISFEVASGQELPLPKASMRIVVLKSVISCQDQPYIALLTQRIPRLVTMYEESIEVLSDEEEHGPYCLLNVLANGEPAMIPDLNKLEELVKAA